MQEQLIAELLPTVINKKNLQHIGANEKNTKLKMTKIYPQTQLG